MGAAGRDFHNFNMVLRDNPAYQVVAFTATQIPGISGRRYPAALAGAAYPDGIPILEDSRLEEICREEEIDEVMFAYSDVPHATVMHAASLMDINIPRLCATESLDAFGSCRPGQLVLDQRQSIAVGSDDRQRVIAHLHQRSIELKSRLLGRPREENLGDHAAQLRVGGGGDEVRSAGAKRRQTHARVTRQPAIHGGHEARSLLVARQDECDFF